MPTTSQELLTFDDTSPEVLVGVSLILIGGPSSLLNAFFPSFSSPGADPGISAKLIKDLIHNTTFIMLPFLFQWIYVVVTIEQIIQRNPVIHSGPRFPITFGQVRCSFHVDYDVC